DISINVSLHGATRGRVRLARPTKGELYRGGKCHVLAAILSRSGLGRARSAGRRGRVPCPADARPGVRLHLGQSTRPPRALIGHGVLGLDLRARLVPHLRLEAGGMIEGHDYTIYSNGPSGRARMYAFLALITAFLTPLAQHGGLVILRRYWQDDWDITKATL